jgi:hypothetical protein
MNKNTFKTLSFLTFLLLIVTISCLKKSNKKYRGLSSGFSDSIRLSKAKKFEFQYDGLSPQTSYFVNCKLKFLEIEHHGELTDDKDQIIFENDSIRTIYSIKETYEENDNEAGKNGNKKTDTVFVTDYKNRNLKTYFNDNLIKDQKITKSSRQEHEFLYRVKMYTEKEYNCENPKK